MKFCVKLDYKHSCILLEVSYKHCHDAQNFEVTLQKFDLGRICKFNNSSSINNDGGGGDDESSIRYLQLQALKEILTSVGFYPMTILTQAQYTNP
jgi:hypothetical protein